MTYFDIMAVIWMYIFVHRYAVSRRERIIYESADPDEVYYTKPDVIGAPPATAISMQENPAYEINKAKTTM